MSKKTGIVLINPIASTHGTGIFTYMFTIKINQCHLGEYTVRPKDGSESTSTVPHIFVKNPFVGCRGVFFLQRIGIISKNSTRTGKNHNWDSFCKKYYEVASYISQMLNVWCIYLYLPPKLPKCR